MTSLINYNKDKNTGVIYCPHENKLRKFFLTKLSNKYYQNELNGLKWYNNQLKLKNYDILKIDKIKKNYLEFTPIKGIKLKFWKNIKHYEYKIDQVIEYYLDVWPNEERVPSHGDLTFSNIIFDKNDLKIIDWENFDYKSFWGLDICYFLLSVIFLPNIENNKTYINNEELYIFEKFWSKIFKNREYVYLKNPINFLKKNSKMKNLQERDKNFFLNKVPKQKINQINEIIL